MKLICTAFLVGATCITGLLSDDDWSDYGDDESDDGPIIVARAIIRIPRNYITAGNMHTSGNMHFAGSMGNTNMASSMGAAGNVDLARHMDPMHVAAAGGNMGTAGGNMGTAGNMARAGNMGTAGGTMNIEYAASGMPSMPHGDAVPVVQQVNPMSTRHLVAPRPVVQQVNPMSTQHLVTGASGSAGIGNGICPQSVQNDGYNTDSDRDPMTPRMQNPLWRPRPGGLGRGIQNRNIKRYRNSPE